MSYCKKEGKDKVIFVTEDDHNTPSTVPFPEEDEDDTAAGVILPNGEINWGCPCLGGMATGPCGVDFREAFSCFHSSEAEPKGSDCLESFRTMSTCMSKYPGVYGNKEEDRDPLEAEQTVEMKLVDDHKVETGDIDGFKQEIGADSKEAAVSVSNDSSSNTSSSSSDKLSSNIPVESKSLT